RQQVRRGAVASKDDEVAKVLPREVDLAPDEIVHRAVPPGHGEAESAGAALGLERRAFVLGEGPAPPVVAGGLPTPLGGPSPILQLLRSAVTGIGPALLSETGRHLLVDGHASGLSIGPERTVHPGPLVPRPPH